MLLPSRGGLANVSEQFSTPSYFFSDCDVASRVSPSPTHLWSFGKFDRITAVCAPDGLETIRTSTLGCSRGVWARKVVWWTD